MDRMLHMQRRVSGDPADCYGDEPEREGRTMKVKIQRRRQETPEPLPATIEEPAPAGLNAPPKTVDEWRFMQTGD
ncbi:MAG: hypothetical protein OXC00_07220 [Acidimicrobiaceae bacterium]|nr:hypothetical protein [Acidimicrobiaceae bacterium]